MVHALRESHRVLEPGGLLLDLRPAIVHRRVGLLEHRRFRLLGTMREAFGDDRAATRAVIRVVREGLFRRMGLIRLDCERSMDTLDEFRTWISDLKLRVGPGSHDGLIDRLARSLARPGRRRIAIRAPLEMRVLRKLPLAS